MSEPAKHLHSPSSDSSPIASLLAKRFNMDELSCSVCQLTTGLPSKDYEGITNVGSLPFICHECSTKATNYNALSTNFSALKKKFFEMEQRMATMELTNQKVVELECKLNCEDDRVARIVQMVTDSLNMRFDTKLDNLDHKLDQKLDEFERKSRDADTVQKNKRCLVVSGLPEKEGTVPHVLTTMLNEQFLPALLVQDRFVVVRSYRMGKPLSDGSHRLIKLIFDSETARDIVKSGAVNLKNSTVFKGVCVRPSLSPSQQDYKKKLEAFRKANYPSDSHGRSPVGFRYESDGSPYLWNFVDKARVDVSAIFGCPRGNSNQTF